MRIVTDIAQTSARLPRTLRLGAFMDEGIGMVGRHGPGSYGTEGQAC